MHLRLTLIFILLLPVPSTAQLVTFFGEDFGTGDNEQPLESWPNSDTAFTSFSALYQDIAILDFESYATNSAEPLTLDFDGQGAVLTGRGVVYEIVTGSYAGTFPTSGTHYWLDDARTEPFTIAFSSPQTAFGFYATDVSDFYGTILLRLDDGREIPIPAYEGWPTGSVLFFGIHDPTNPFTSVSLIPDTIDHGWGGSMDGFGVDDLVIGLNDAVPSEIEKWGAIKATFR